MDYKYNVISEHPLRHRCDLRIVCAQDVGFSQLLELVAGERKAYFRAQKKSHNRIKTTTRNVKNTTMATFRKGYRLL